MAESAEAPIVELAALDLGTNSFHLIVARRRGEQLQVIDRYKEMVRLGGGLDSAGNLSSEACDRALDSLARIAQRLRPIHEANVRVVGTITLRRARNARAFLKRAEATLGHRIEVISGREEARLIYAGVCHSVAPNGERRLVLDIGGGSTELVLGRDHTPRRMESLHMGCVYFSESYFGERIRTRQFERAELAARQELEPIEAEFLKAGWDTALGASGTVIAVRDVAIAMGLSNGDIPMAAIGGIKRAMLEGDSKELPGLSAERGPVFPGGIAILSAVMTALHIDVLKVSDGALREGLLVDLLGRSRDSDQRDRSITDLAERYQVDAAHASRVSATASALLAEVAGAWALNEPQWARLLSWAAAVHEIGTQIAYSQYHKHGHYLLLNIDLPGFSRDDQRRLALLVRSHRRRFPTAEFAMVADDEREPLLRLAALLRIAVVLHRNRADDPPPPISARVQQDCLVLEFPTGWFDAHPLTRLDLEQEQEFLQRAPLRLTVAGIDAPTMGG